MQAGNLVPRTIFARPSDIVKAFDPKQARKNVKHIKLRTAREQKRMYAKLTLDERGFLFSLLPYLDWETNILVGDGEIEEMHRPLNWARVDEIVGISKPHRIKLVRALEGKRVIGYLEVQGQRVCIVINPEYALRGKRPKEALKQVFACNQDVWDDYE